MLIPNFEQGGDLVEGFVFRLRHLVVREDPEDGEKHGEGKEGVVLQHGLKILILKIPSFSLMSLIENICSM